MQVTNKKRVPTSWCSFFRHNDNRTYLFHFLADKVTHMTMSNMTVVTRGPNVLSISETSLDSLDKCFHEKAESHISVHVRCAAEEGSKAITFKANDNNVLVIALNIFPSLQDLGL